MSFLKNEIYTKLPFCFEKQVLSKTPVMQTFFSLTPINTPKTYALAKDPSVMSIYSPKRNMMHKGTRFHSAMLSLNSVPQENWSLGDDLSSS